MCKFCERFDFKSASYEIDKYGVRVVLAGGSYRFPEHLQFNHCPVCGEARTHIAYTTAQGTVDHTIDMGSYTLALETLDELAGVGKLDKELSIFLHTLFENARHEMVEADSKALTVEQLKSMVGKPVVLETGEVSIKEQLVAEWEILDSCDDDVFFFTRRARGFSVKNYGKTWLAYRCPPEKGDHHKV